MNKISSVIAVCIAAGTLLFSGCISAKRMARISPLSESDGTRMSVQRSNAWPIYYGTGAGFSVLWPFLDFDNNGWAFRPFYAQENDERSVLWPLSGWNNDGGWALISYWDYDDYVGMFPLFHFSTNSERGYDLNYVIPFWWKNDGADWGLFPLGSIGRNDWRLLNFYYENTEKRAHWNFWPLLYRKSNLTREEVDWRLLYGLLGGYEDNKNETSAWLVPLFWNRSKKGENENSAWVFPTFFRSRDNEVYTNTILPLYYYNTRGNDNYVFATALGGWGKFSDGGHLRYVFGPLYIDYASPSEKYEFSSVLWPLYMRSRDGNAQSTYLFPFGHKWTDGKETRRGFLLGLGATRSLGDDTSWAVWPLYGSRKKFADADFRYWLTLSGNRADSNESANWLFPFYYYNSSANDTYSFSALCYLFGIHESVSFTQKRHFENYLFPFYFYDSWTNPERFSDRPYLRKFYIPLVYGFKNEYRVNAEKKSWEHWALLDLFNFEGNYYSAIPNPREEDYQQLSSTSCYRYINTFWETREFRVWKDGVLTPREQEIIDRAEHSNRLYGGNSLRRKMGSKNTSAFSGRNTFRYDFDKEIFGKNEQPCEEKRKAFFRRELIKILQDKGITVADDADKTALFDAVRKLAETHAEILTEKEFQVWPFYEATDDAFGGYEKELLWGLWCSSGNVDESFTSCAKYLYRRETTKDGTKLDVFPFISVDTGKRGAFSFLGNFFKIVNDDEKGWSGNFLFIPWGNENQR